MIRVKLITTHPEQGPTRYLDMAVMPKPGSLLRITDMKTDFSVKWQVREVVHTTSGYVEVHL